MIEVWGIPLDGVMWYCVGGGSFFAGGGLLAACMLGAVFASKIWHNFLIYFGVVISAFFIYMAAMPFSNLFYTLWALIIFGGLLGIHFKSKKKIPVNIIVIGITLIAIFSELPDYLTPTISSEGYNRLFVVGDSISDGIGTEDERTWPKIMVEEGFEVIDVSRAGATSLTAVKRQIHRVSDDKGIVILEIGGNDALMGTPYDEYEKALREILSKVLTEQHTVIMLEVPVLPWHIEYGRILRKTAKEFDVSLVPKKFLAGIFSAKGATLDLAHLSPKGHELMARKILLLIR